MEDGFDQTYIIRSAHDSRLIIGTRTTSIAIQNIDYNINDKGCIICMCVTTRHSIPALGLPRTRSPLKPVLRSIPR